MPSPLRPYLVPLLLVLSAILGVYGLFSYAGKNWEFSWSESPAREKDLTGPRAAGTPVMASEKTAEPVVKSQEATSPSGWMTEMLANWLKYQEDLTHWG